ncbi:MAG: hypothetical protein CXT73_06410 [Methanobacteriota archaeon]|nr:MAG: hypothetical protein CXT73_06410 [Euryarchaeota archaeon]
MWYEGPAYENSGPCVEDVREDMLISVSSHIWFNLNSDEVREQKLIEIIEKIVPDTRNDFGSYRNYYCIMGDILKKIEKEIMDYLIENLKKKKAKRILQATLLPLIIHRLYKPGGMRYHQHKEHFEKLK